MKTKILLLTVTIVTLVLCGCIKKNTRCAYPGDPGDTSTGRPPKPATPSSPGFPKGKGFKGAWATTHEPVTSPGVPHDFVWQSDWLTSAGKSDTKRARNRAIIFRLEGNAKVRITGVSGRGTVASGGRSAYSCCDGAGQITVTITTDPMASLENPNIGKLWGIDAMGGGTAAGDVAEFEVVSP